jgi:ATP-binding cassette, subfamily B, bacterial MsbA
MEATRYAGHLGQVFQGIRHVKAYRMEAVESAQTGGFIERINAGHERQALIQSLSAPVLEIIGSMALVLFLLVGGHRVETGQLCPGTLATLASCLLAVSFLMRNVGTAQVTAQNALVALSRIYQIIDLPRHIVDAPGAAPLHWARETSASKMSASATPALTRHSGKSIWRFRAAASWHWSAPPVPANPRC